MNDSNPYESPANPSKPTSWRPIDFVAAGIWLAIPIGLFFGRRLLLPVVADFELELPRVTQLLLHFYAPVPFAVFAIIVIVAASSLPSGNVRRRFVLFAWISGFAVAAVCLWGFLVPLRSLWQNLS